MKRKSRQDEKSSSLRLAVSIRVILAALLLSCLHIQPSAHVTQPIVAADNAETQDPNIELLNDVWQKVLAVVPRAPGLEWPPKLHVLTANDVKALKTLTGQEMPPDPNAFATVCVDPRVPFCTGPVVCVNNALLEKVVDGNAHRLAFILGHELSHLTLGHSRPRAKAATGLLELVYSRDKEIAADKSGIEVALAAGYSLAEALGAPKRFIELGLEHPPLWPADHPSWTQRLALLDKNRPGLWRQMGAFNNGVLFLNIEQYGSAEKCFAAVVKEFPDCVEAQANLGYALLMQYCDLLTEDDLREFDVGHIMIGGFYARPQTLIERGRGKNKDLWTKAVAALQEAIRLKPDLALAQANLGIAYLLHPDRRDVEKATSYLKRADDLVQRSGDRTGRALVLVNLAVADLASGNADLCDQHLDEASRLTGGNPTIKATVFYNRALVQLKKGGAASKHDATVALANFLQATSPASIWWKLGFEQFAQLCSEQKLSCVTKEQVLARVRTPMRPIPSVNAGKRTVQLGDSMDDVKKRFGETASVPVARGSKLKRLNYPANGIAVIGDDGVLAIALQGRSSPPLELQRVGAGGGKVAIRVGMTEQGLNQVLGTQFAAATIFNPTIRYRFYPEVGLAVRIDQGRVTEMLVVILPRQA